ncbi:MAG: hydrogenase maturation peptidase HycI [Candidatus Omnitrophica bacterium]|nr:hydrogenase maturation peptidase HycI [Candidatus Omnitrophota bacterium]MDD5237211.1 hydrogenase maturation peptidase HycI [Candidatus Omnitrophota bacterium]MDD5610247.1 hydrogenase maturation peptidase HycI [Candidatus Omnitrophota bacterium]
MQNLKNQLKNKLKNTSRAAVLGIGSELRADDAVGMLVARELQKAAGENSRIKCFLAGASPENFTGEIKKFNPTHVIIVDAAQLEKSAGEARLIEEEEINGVSFSTHRLPTKILIDYLKSSLRCEFVVIGIQPKTLKFGEPVSPEAARAAGAISLSLQEILCA